VVAKIAVWSRDAKSATETLLAWKDANALVAKIAALLEVVWQRNWLFVGSGLVAK
jgi:hypothetical protein